MNEGAVEGLSKSKKPEKLSQKFLKSVRRSNEVFSAFKVHAMGKAMQQKLLDEKGKLRSFEEWKKVVAPIASHHVGAWLRTEYDTAVIRAHQAADWQDFIANKDILPNLRWMPTTSPTPEGTHKTFWERRLTLPVDDPFWATQHPGNRWNCKCALDATDDPVSDDAGDFREEAEPTAQRGLGTNPKDGTLIDDKHPYFPEKCNACPYYQKSRKGLKGMLKALFENKKKKCETCPHIDEELAKARYPENYAKYQRYLNDPEYREVIFDIERGGFRAKHILHKTSGNKETYFDGLTSSKLEDNCVNILYKKGNAVVLHSEKEKDEAGNTKSALDMSLNETRMDIRSITSDNETYVNALSAKNKQLSKYNAHAEEKCDTVCLYFHDPSMYSREKILESIKDYHEMFADGKAIRKKYDKLIKQIYVVVNTPDGGEVIIYPV